MTSDHSSHYLLVFRKTSARGTSLHEDKEVRYMRSGFLYAARCFVGFVIILALFKVRPGEIYISTRYISCNVENNYTLDSHDFFRCSKARDRSFQDFY